jgi:hypothetical protein
LASEGKPAGKFFRGEDVSYDDTKAALQAAKNTDTLKIGGSTLRVTCDREDHTFSTEFKILVLID